MRVLFVLGFLFLTSCQKPADIVTQLTILKINGKQVTAKEFAQALARKLKSYDALAVKDPRVLKRAKEDLVQLYVLEVITRQFAIDNNIIVPADQLNAEIDTRKRSFPDEFAFRRNLADENLSFDEWKKQVETSLIQRRVQAHITRVAKPPTDEEVKAFYQANPMLFNRPARVKLRQIVLEKEDDAKRVFEQLSKGAGKMADLAKKFSVAPEAQNNGETDWLEKGVLDVFDQAFKMPVGSRSKILRSPYGWHIYDVMKKEPDSRLSFNDAKAKIRAQLFEDRQQTAFAAWLEEQVRKSKVYRNESLLESISVSTKATSS